MYKTTWEWQDALVAPMLTNIKNEWVSTQTSKETQLQTST